MAWAPGRESRQAWRAWASTQATADGAAASCDSQPRELPLPLRRRCGPFGRRVLTTALACRGAEQARFIFSSRHGDLARTATILAALAAQEMPSPTEFSMSVHHAWASLLSIHTVNRGVHAAIAAGPDSFGFGFLEAALCALDQTDTPVLLVYGDDAAPPDFEGLELDRRAALPLVVAVLLERPSHAQASRFAATPAGTTPWPEEAEGPAPAFLRFLLSEDRPSATAAGERMQWRWSRGGAAC